MLKALSKLHPFGLAWLAVFIAVAVWITIVSGDDLFGFTVFLAGVLCVFLAANGSILNYPIGTYNTLGYALMAWRNGLFGEVGLNLLFYLPMNVAGFFMWRKHMDGGVVVMRGLRGRQILVVAALSALCTVGLGYGLSLLAGQNTPYVDAATNVLSVVATILMLCRYREQWYAYILLNVLTVAMWAMRAAAGSPEGPIMIVMWSAFLINAFYGLHNWNQGARRAEAGVPA